MGKGSLGKPRRLRGRCRGRAHKTQIRNREVDKKKKGRDLLDEGKP